LGLLWAETLVECQLARPFDTDAACTYHFWLRNFAMIGDLIGQVFARIIDFLVAVLARLNPNPNLLSVIGLSINVFAALLYGYGEFFWAGLVMIAANVFDMLDGRVARLTGRQTKFGAFL